MVKKDQALRIPNPHKQDIGRDLLATILREGAIERENWERL